MLGRLSSLGCPVYISRISPRLHIRDNIVRTLADKYFPAFKSGKKSFHWVKPILWFESQNVRKDQAVLSDEIKIQRNILSLWSR